jgi:dipeptidyl aminopeptidase/acylaminoacyl peptidase
MTTALSPEQIASAWSPSDPQVSPDGRYVAWTAAPFGKEGEHPETGIWVAPVDGSSAPRRWTHGGDDVSPRWSPDGSRLAFLSDRHERGTHGLYVLESAGGEATALVVRSRSVAAFAWSPDGARVAFLAPDEPTEEDKRREKERDDPDVYGERWEHHRLWFVDAGGGEPEVGWAPARHLTALAWSPDGGRLALIAQDAPPEEYLESTAIHVLTPGTGDVRDVAQSPFISEVGWSGPELLVYAAPHEPVPQCSSTVWAVQAQGGDPQVIGTGRDEPRCTIGLAQAANADWAVLVIAEGLATRLEQVSPKTGQRTVLQEVTGEVDGLSVTDTTDGPVIAAVQLGDELVARVVAGPPGTLRPLSDHGAELEQVRAGTVEALYCTASDGIDLDAVVIRPPLAGDGPWPTAVLLHGGPYGRSGLWSHMHPLEWGQLLATRGYAVVLPNYRGGYGHGNAFATSVRGDMGGAEWGDVVSIVDAAVAAGIADPDRMGIGGWSQGGFLTAWAVTATDRFKVGVMGAGVSDWGMLAATSDLPSFEAALGGDNRWDGPGPHHADAHSPISFAARRTTPLLILHGAEDKRVPFTQATAFHRAIAGQAAPVQMVSYPREPHGIRERRHQVDLQHRVVEWFERYVRTAAP